MRAASTPRSSCRATRVRFMREFPGSRSRRKTQQADARQPAGDGAGHAKRRKPLSVATGGRPVPTLCELEAQTDSQRMERRALEAERALAIDRHGKIGVAQIRGAGAQTA